MNHIIKAILEAFENKAIEELKDDLREHLLFVSRKNGTFLGIMKGITKKGDDSVKYYHLDRKALDKKRKAEQEQVVKDLEYFIVKDRNKLTCILDEIKKGSREFSAAALAQAISWKEQLIMHFQTYSLYNFLN